MKLDKPQEFQSFPLLSGWLLKLGHSALTFFFSQGRRHVAGSLKPSLEPGETLKPSKSPNIAKQLERSAEKIHRSMFSDCFFKTLQMSNQNDEASKLGSSTGHGRSDVGEATFVALTSCGLRYTTSTARVVVSNFLCLFLSFSG